MSEEGDFILLPCHNLLKELADRLKSPTPKYVVEETAHNKVAVIVHPATSAKPQKFVGEARMHLASSAQDAARLAIKTLAAQHFIGVEDITLLTQEFSDRVSGLYELKRLEMLRAEAKQDPSYAGENSFKARAIYSDIISVNFRMVLGLIMEKYKVKASAPFDVMERTPSGWVAWGELTCPTMPMRIKPFISDKCIDEEGAWQSLAKKCISYLIGVYNFQVIDINFDYMKGALLRAFAKQHLKLYEDVKFRINGLLEIPNPYGQGPSQSSICNGSGQCPSATTACQSIPILSTGKQTASPDATTSSHQGISASGSLPLHGCPLMSLAEACILVGEQPTCSEMNKADMDTAAYTLDKHLGKRKVINLEPLSAKKKRLQLGDGYDSFCCGGMLSTELCLAPPAYDPSPAEPTLPPI